MKKVLSLIIAILGFSVFVFAQTPTPTPPEDIEKVETEEIKVSIRAIDERGNFAQSLNKEDVVISENGRLHQANSLRRIPANVLILLDVGNEISYAKTQKNTLKTAKNIVESLQTDDSIAVMQYGDKVELISDWNKNRDETLQNLTKKLGFGKRSVFYDAINQAIDFFQKTPTENRHLILISDGIDSFNKSKEFAYSKLFSSDINVHILSYTKMQQQVLAPKTSILQKGESKPQRLPEEILITMPQDIQRAARMPRIGSINMDREMIKKQKAQAAAIKTSEVNLTEIAENTNGEIFLPETNEEMLEKTKDLAKIIDSQYVITYTPKRALSDSPNGEVRLIEVSSKRESVIIQARRKLIVRKEK
ncbi:MAG: VWA domain-containing protein [Pyrinomonadaceae bacterium]|jgi:hypothetical protein|nr:VWA domain-containing protein [Pyrinomonadaceae bacterium]